MVIDDSIKFADLATKLKLENIDIFSNYFDGFTRTCKCKPSIKQLYLDNMEKSYIDYISKNHDYLKQKIESSDINDSIIEFKSKNKSIFTININRIDGN